MIQVRYNLLHINLIHLFIKIVATWPLLYCTMLLVVIFELIRQQVISLRAVFEGVEQLEVRAMARDADNEIMVKDHGTAAGNEVDKSVRKSLNSN